MSAQEEHIDKQRRHAFHQQNMQGGQQEREAAEILRALSEIDDLPIDPQEDRIMGQLISKLASTANLTTEEVRSNEWVREYIFTLYLCKKPTQDGCHGPWRGWSHGNADAAVAPLSPQERMEWEAFVSNSKIALTRSEDSKVIEEATRDVSESIVSDGESGPSGGGGLLARLKGDD